MQVCKTLRGCKTGTHVAVTFAALSQETTRGGKPPRKVAEEELEQAFESLAPVTTAVSKVGEGRRKEGGNASSQFFDPIPNNSFLLSIIFLVSKEVRLRFRKPNHRPRVGR